MHLMCCACFLQIDDEDRDFRRSRRGTASHDQSDGASRLPPSSSSTHPSSSHSGGGGDVGGGGEGRGRKRKKDEENSGTTGNQRYVINFHVSVILND